MSRNQQKFDVHQEVTNRIVAALETAGEFQLPWIRSRGGSMKRPVNIASAKPYNGVNIVSLWVAAQACDYPSHLWGTYRQWQERGCQVRRGEKSSLIVFYKKLEFEQTDEQTGETEAAERLMARASFVFNAAQVDGFKLDDTSQPLPDALTFDPIERAEAFAKATGAKIEEGGDMACYIPAADMIRLPERRRFTGTETTTPAEGFYSTLCHELVHWSGAKGRLDRDLTGRFGSESYAAEELVAELGAAFLCGDLGITPEPNTKAIWATRSTNLVRIYGGGDADRLPARGELGADTRDLVESGRVPLVAGFAILGIREEGGRMLVGGESAEGPHTIGPVDRIVAATGQRPDLSLTRELRLDLDPWLESTKALGPLIDPNEHSCGSVPPHGHRELAHLEPGFYTVGIKSYGRAPTFLLLTGYEQVRSVAAAIAGDMAAADNIHLVLPETGVCVTDFDVGGSGSGCCGGPAPAGIDVCCVADAVAKEEGKKGCGCGVAA